VTQVRLVAEPRSDFGKGAARRLRRSGRVPAVLYGSGSALTHVSLDDHDLTQGLRRPQVVFEIELAGDVTLAKPRDIQRDPVRQILEHIDLVVVSRAEAQARGAMAEAIRLAEELAVEAGIDPAAAVLAVQEAVANGEDATEAARHAVADVRAQAEAFAEASAAAEAAEEAEAAEGELAEGAVAMEAAEPDES
jgi:large subunit ribosomal protein L25